jgi:hypothetical protein
LQQCIFQKVLLTINQQDLLKYKFTYIEETNGFFLNPPFHSGNTGSNRGRACDLHLNPDYKLFMSVMIEKIGPEESNINLKKK